MSKRPIEEVEAGYAFRETLVARADSDDGIGGPLWHGWAIMDAFLAGIDYARKQRSDEGGKDAELVREAVEVRTPDGTIDEICARKCDLHIEQLDASSWFIGVDGADGSYWQFWLGAKNMRSHVEMRHTETVPAADRLEALSAC